MHLKELEATRQLLKITRKAVEQADQKLADHAEAEASKIMKQAFEDCKNLLLESGMCCHSSLTRFDNFTYILPQKTNVLYNHIESSLFSISLKQRVVYGADSVRGRVQGFYDKKTTPFKESFDEIFSLTHYRCPGSIALFLEWRKDRDAEEAAKEGSSSSSASEISVDSSFAEKLTDEERIHWCDLIP